MADYKRQVRPKKCQCCKEGIEHVDYKNVDMLKKYTSERGKIKPRRVTGACTKHQREIAAAIKRARVMALLPYSEVTVAGRGGRRKR
ncbi:MAG: 30S ribosomal protein S18 [Phoenicibacter congonensis]|uniref:Small ribosomal subunit protein bS18 n=1 Tax=Phoenicibacter congonensis TaxID=1944646 RepID=A0AA43U5M2_9ACTN|nr:30S ribosomal protein S18 [Phoenicibacter congonensis]MDO4841363.1 30S ribosomal protein S18 [Phoenicibacter congonensis]